MIELTATEGLSIASASKEPSGFLRLKGTIAKEAVMEFEGKELHPSLAAHDKIRIFRSAEALSDPETMSTLAKAPLLRGHHRENVGGHLAGYPVGEPRRTSEATVGIDYLLTSAEAIDDYESGKAQELSPHYRFMLVDAPPGADYDYSMAHIRVEHVAQVPKGRNGPTIRLSEEEDMSEVTLSEESQKGLVTKLAEAIKAAFTSSEEDKDKPPPTTPPTPDPKKTYTREEVEEEKRVVGQLYSDKALVQPLLSSELQRDLIDQADTSLEVLARAIGVSEEDAKNVGPDVLRGRVQEKLNVKLTEQKSVTSWESTPHLQQQQDANAGLAKFYENMQKQATRNHLDQPVQH